MKTILEKLSKENTVLLKDEMKRIQGGMVGTLQEDPTMDTQNCQDSNIYTDKGGQNQGKSLIGNMNKKLEKLGHKS